MTLAFQLEMAIHTKNESNGSFGVTRAAMYARAGDTKRQRDTARALVGAYVQARGAAALLPCVVFLWRVSSGKGLDPHDGLRNAFKHVVDGIADALGLKNDRDRRVEWRYDQQSGPRGKHAVIVRVVPRAELRCACRCSSCGMDLHHACLFRGGCDLTAGALRVDKKAAG